MKLNQFSMFSTAFIVTSFALLATTACADVEDKITKSFKVASGDQLVVEVDRGGVEIKTTTDGDSVDIEVSRKAGGSQAKADQILKDHVLTTTQTDNKVEVRAEYQGPKKTGWFGNSVELQVDYVITVPRKFNVDLKTAGGHVAVRELIGKLNANTSGGNLTFEKIEGAVSGNAGGGHIKFAGGKGAANLKTSGGNLNLSDIAGDVIASTSGGHITVSKLVGNSVLKTSGGNIELSAINGSVEARTSGGHITASFVAQPEKNCSFDTSGGNITIALTDQVAADVDLHTSGGRVTTDFPVATVVRGEQKQTELRGKVNGGGPLIKAHTSGGHVRLQKTKSVAAR
jgi:hypothetical protein